LIGSVYVVNFFPKELLKISMQKGKSLKLQLHLDNNVTCLKDPQQIHSRPITLN